MDPFSHSMNLPRNFLDSVSPGIEGLGFVEDFALGWVNTENGTLRVVQIFPLMERHAPKSQCSDFTKFMARLVAQEGDALWRTKRRSLLGGEAGEALINEAEREGSQLGLEFTAITWTPGELHLDALSRKSVMKFLRYRLAHHARSAERGGRRPTLESAKHDTRIERAGGVKIRVSHELLGRRGCGAESARRL